MISSDSDVQLINSPSGDNVTLYSLFKYIRDDNLKALFNCYQSDYKHYVVTTLSDLGCSEGLKRLMDMGETICQSCISQLIGQSINDALLREWIDRTRAKYSREYSLINIKKYRVRHQIKPKTIRHCIPSVERFFHMLGIPYPRYIGLANYRAMKKLSNKDSVIKFIMEKGSLYALLEGRPVDQKLFDRFMIGLSFDELLDYIVFVLVLSAIYGRIETAFRLLENSSLLSVRQALEYLPYLEFLPYMCQYGKRENARLVIERAKLTPNEILPLACQMEDVNLVDKMLTKVDSIRDDLLSATWEISSYMIAYKVFDAIGNDRGITDPIGVDRLPKWKPIPIRDEFFHTKRYISSEPFYPYPPSDDTDHLIGRKFSGEYGPGRVRIVSKYEKVREEEWYELKSRERAIYYRAYPYSLGLLRATINNDLVGMENFLYRKYSSPNIALVNATSVEAVNLALKYGATEIGVAMEYAIVRGNLGVIRRLLEFKPVVMESWIDQVIYTGAVDILSMLLRYDEGRCIELLTRLNSQPRRMLDNSRSFVSERIEWSCLPAVRDMAARLPLDRIVRLKDLKLSIEQVCSGRSTVRKV